MTVADVFQGISCFDYSRNWNVIATGSVDHIIRLWNPVSTFKPMALLKGHTMAVLGVLIHEELGQVISYSQDVVKSVMILVFLNIW